MLKDDLTILVNSCDAYSDCWYPFFKLWYHYFPDHSIKIILNTESKSFSFDGLDIECFSLYPSGSRPAFGEQMNAHLKLIKTPFVLTMLEDFFLNTRVDIQRIEQCVEWLKNDEKAAQFYFTNVVDEMNSISDKYPGFSKKDQVSPYKVNTMAGVWKKEKLLQYSIKKATPWEWEYYGTIRSFETADEFYALSKDSVPIMNFKILPEAAYNLKLPQLWGIVRGKWVVESVDELFKKNGIEVDYSERGIFSPDELRQSMQKKELSVSLEELVGTKAANDITRFERINKIKKMLHMKTWADYIEYRRSKIGL